MSQNPDALKALYMENYRGFSLRGELETLDLILACYRPGAVKLTSYEVKGQTAEVFGEVGIVTGTGAVQGSYEGQKFEHRLCFTDVYLKRDGSWRCYRSQATEISSSRAALPGRKM